MYLSLIARGLVGVTNVLMINLLSFFRGDLVSGQFVGLIGLITIFCIFGRLGWEQKMLSKKWKYVPTVYLIISSFFSFFIFKFIVEIFSISIPINKEDLVNSNILLVVFLTFLLANLNITLESLMRQDLDHSSKLIILATISPSIGILFSINFLNQDLIIIPVLIYFLSIFISYLLVFKLLKIKVIFKNNLPTFKKDQLSILYFPASINSMINQYFTSSLLMLTGNEIAIVYFSTMQRITGFSKWPITIFTFSYNDSIAKGKRIFKYSKNSILILILLILTGFVSYFYSAYFSHVYLIPTIILFLIAIISAYKSDSVELALNNGSFGAMWLSQIVIIPLTIGLFFISSKILMITLIQTIILIYTILISFDKFFFKNFK